VKYRPLKVGFMGPLDLDFIKHRDTVEEVGGVS
jgi:hypothetical protein